MARVRIKIGDGLNTLGPRLRQAVTVAREGQRLHAETQIKQSLRNVNAVASQELLNSTATELSSDMRQLRAGVTAKQGKWVEVGRKPGKVPAWRVFRPILRAWATLKGIAIDDGGLYAIARKLREQGFAGRYPIQKARDAMSPGLFNILRNALGAALRK